MQENVAISSIPASVANAGQCTTLETFERRDYEQLKSDINIVSENLKRGLEGDETATAVAEAVHRTWRNAIARAKGNIRADQKLLEKINADLASQLSLHQLQEFARQVADSLKPQNLIMDVQEERKSFIYYITQYVDGKFVDHFGNAVPKPSIGTVISDTDIDNLVIVVIEYLIDTFDGTPAAWGADPTYSPSTKPSFPSLPGTASAGTSSAGATVSSLPTILDAFGKGIPVRLGYLATTAPYEQLDTLHGCGITEAKYRLMTRAASGSAVAGTLASGLVSQSWGGFEFGFLGLIKFSIGDNQILASVVKAAAGRIAERAAFAATYYALHQILLPTKNGSSDPIQGITPKQYQAYLDLRTEER
jgi:hypothetical protein